MNLTKQKISPILASVLTFMITLGAMVAAQNIYQFQIGVRIEVPQGQIEIVGLDWDDYGNKVLPKLTLKNDQATATFTIRNVGGIDYKITKSITSPSSLDADLEAYVAHSTGGDAWKAGDTFILPRGVSADIQLVVIDLGADSGIYDVQISIVAEPN